MRVIIDTDPGIDDAIAILYALRHPGLEVAALTTVAGNIGLSTTTRNACRIATLAGVSVPVYAGADRPLKRASRFETAIHGNDGLGGVAFPEPGFAADTESATSAMRRLAETADEPLTLMCLGPLTNLARLLEESPETGRRFERVIAMGGAVDEPGNVGPKAEFNIAHDPEAASAVFAAGLPLTLIPLDATRQLRADANYIAELREAGSPSAKASADLIAAYFAATDGAESRPLHDPCVPLLALEPSLFSCQTHRLAVDTESGALTSGPHALQVAMGLDAPALRKALLDGLNG